MITVEQIGWSIRSKSYARFRLTYLHTYIPERDCWRDFLVHSEELELLKNGPSA